MKKIIVRPLSPHVSVYQPQWNSMFSLFHRISGSVLVISLFTFFLFSIIYSFHATRSYELFSFFLTLEDSKLFSFVELTILFALSYHIINGIHHIMIENDKYSEIHLKWPKTTGLILLFVVVLLFFYISFYV
uniref:Succinate:cytochrome c oxidoreductase subunit 3 n=1 Tax=Mesostigma viride TaxID=41882 RepID=Q8W9Q8_MESVI|nr:succinate:cytochrome c oxidoreductase subunit 3 [Mesostigma viride]AAL36750.1 succinate:cytochrome c oxidoreductase subunit 3 [Mesostigma viride]